MPTTTRSAPNIFLLLSGAAALLMTFTGLFFFGSGTHGC